MSEKEQVLLADLFNSFQGEFPYQGRFATFIRFSKCNLKCKWCDTMENNLDMKTKPYTYQDINDLVAKSNMLTFTGGEPSLYTSEMLDIADYIVSANIYLSNITIETNGVQLGNLYEFVSQLSTIIPNAQGLCRIVWSPKFYNKNLSDIMVGNLYDIFDPKFTLIKLVSEPNELTAVENFISIALNTYGIKVKRNIAIMFHTDANDKYSDDNMHKAMEIATRYGVAISTRIHLEHNFK
jgi:organic radical activating enzyme